MLDLIGNLGSTEHRSMAGRSMQCLRLTFGIESDMKAFLIWIAEELNPRM
ncbi:hypothetical protein [Mesorhizobium sp. M0768]